MERKRGRGRPNIFGNRQRRDTSRLINGYVSTRGKAWFEGQRTALAKLSGFKRPGDGDTLEYISMGHEAAVAYFTKQSGA